MNIMTRLLVYVGLLFGLMTPQAYAGPPAIPPSALNASAISSAGGSLRRNSKRLYPLGPRNGAFSGLSAASEIQSTRQRIKNGKVALTNLRVRVANWYIQPGATTLLNTGNPIKVSFSIEYPIGTQPKQFFAEYGGSAQPVVPDGATIDMVEVTGLVIPGDADFYIHSYGVPWASGALGGVLPLQRYIQFNSSGSYRDNLAKDTAGATTDKTTTIGGETNAYASASTIFTPFAVLGQPVYGGTPLAVLIFGDSLARSHNEWTYKTSDSYGNQGALERWLGSGSINYVNISTGGLRADQIAASTLNGNLNRLYAAVRDFGTDVIIEQSVNDFTNGRTAVQVIADKTVIGNAFAAMDFRVYNTTSTPRSSSASGNWTSDADQTPTGGSTEKAIYNAAVVAGFGPFRKYIDMYGLFVSPTKDGVFKSDGTNKKYTDDGTHGVQALYSQAPAFFGDPNAFFGN